MTPHEVEVWVEVGFKIVALFAFIGVLVLIGYTVLKEE